MKNDDKQGKHMLDGVIDDKSYVVNIDFKKSYQFTPEEFEIEITSTHYSNNSYIQVMADDVFIDFLELPGVKKDGKMVANATRVYLTLPQAKKLADILGKVLEKSLKI